MSPVIDCRIVCGSNGGGPGNSGPNGGGPGNSGPNGGGPGNSGPNSGGSGYSVPNGISFGSPGCISGPPFSVKSGFVSTSMLILILGLGGPVINEIISHNFLF